MGLVLVREGRDGGAPPASPGSTTEPPSFTLNEVPVPDGVNPGGATTRTFRAVRRIFRPDQDARNRKLGLAGETLVFEVERQRLVAAGRPDLADAVVHVSVVEGDGAGYDIRSIDN